MVSLENEHAMIMSHYSNMFVKCDDYEVKQFYGLLSLFLAKCDGLLSPAEVQRLETTYMGIATFSPYATPVEQKEKILAKVKFLKKHHINKPAEIIRILTQVIYVDGQLGATYRKYLVEFEENPGKPFNWYAGRLKVGASSVTRAYQRLRRRIELRFGSYTNYPMFKLKHFILYFRPEGSFRTTMLSRRAFTKSLNYDTFGDWMWASFLVPDQDRILKEFKNGLPRFSSEVLCDHRLYEVKSIGKHSNLAMFDGKKWSFSEETFGVGAFEFAEANKGILPRMKEFRYGESSIRFDQVDFLLAFLGPMDAHPKTSEFKEVLMENGHRNLSLVTIQRKLDALKRKGALFPICTFSGLDLNFASPFAAECDDNTLETLYHLFPMFPECWAYRTDKGVAGMIVGPPEMSSSISYVLQGVKNKVDDLLVTSRFANIGTRSQVGLCKYWNVEKQYWDFEKGFFDLTKGLGERT